MQRRILVTGATGNLGSKVAAELLNNSAVVKVTGRNYHKLVPFAGKAEIIIGDLEDESFLQQALENVHFVFLVLPALKQLSIKDFAHKLLRTAQAKGVTHIVNISNCTLTRYNKPTSLLEFEKYLNQSTGIHIKHLRCANFFENLNWGINTPYHPDIRLPYISSYEIAFIAARYLQHRNFQGCSVEELMGRADYSMRDFAQMLGVEYQQLPTTVENSWFFDAFNSGLYQLVTRTAENTSRLQEERFSLAYFLEHDFNKELIKQAI